MESGLKNSLKRILVICVLLIIPAVILITSVQSIRVVNKNWYSGGYDPSYAYLYNSLNMARFKVAGHVDHPGTTAQVFGGAVLQAAWMVHPYGGDYLIEAVVNEPEHYLRILNIATAIAGAIFLLGAGFFVMKMSQNVWYALILQTIPFISGIILYNGFLRISQESMLMISSIAMASAALFWFFKNSNYPPKQFAIMFGVISGFGLASKIIFAPLMIVPLLILSPNKSRIRFLLVSVLSFIFFTLPIIPMYPHMGKWFYALFFHSGIYGSGDASIIDTVNYMDNFRTIVTGEPLYLMVYLLTIVALLTLIAKRVFKKVCYNRPATILLMGLLLAQTFGFFLVAKHPKLAYLLPYECLSAANIILIIHLITDRISKPIFRKAMTVIIVVPVVLLTIKTGLASKAALFSGDNNHISEEAWNTAANTGEGWAVIGVNPGPSPIAADFFANSYSKNRYSDNLQKCHPDYYILNIYASQIENWHREPVSFSDLLEKYHGKVAIVTGDYSVDQTRSLLLKDQNNLKLEAIYTSGVQVLIPISTNDSLQYQQPMLVYSGAEESRAGSREVKSFSKAPFRSFGEFSDLKAYQGKGSILTNSKSPYAFTILQDQVVPGVKFHISVYANGDPSKAQIIASGNNSKEYYLSADAIKEQVTSDWYKITMEVTIVQPLSDRQLVIYCINTGSGNIYFDDFKVERLYTDLSNVK